MARSALWRRHPSAFLLAAQLLSLMLYPAMDNSDSGRLLFGAVGVIVLALALWVVNRSASVNWVAWALAAPAVALTVGSIVFHQPEWVVLSAIFESALYLYVAGSLISYMLHDHVVTADELFAAGATFTLLAWAFAYAFYVCQAWYPDSFTGLVDPGEPRSWMELLFLSFTTLSGVGIGDILPLRAPAPARGVLEQFAGGGDNAAHGSRQLGRNQSPARR